MVKILKTSLIICSTIIGQYLGAQTYDGAKGYSVYHKQDKSFVSPDLRVKHSISIGLIAGGNSPFGSNDDSENGSNNSSENTMGTGFHLGYNYLILEQKKKIKKRKNKVKTRDVVKASIGFHADVLNGGEFLLTAKYYNPFLRAKGFIMTYYFLSEYGLGIHKLPTFLNDDQLKFNFSLELIRIRFFKTPLYLHFNTNYDLSNNFLNTDRKNLQFMGGLRFYFYKNKYR